MLSAVIDSNRLIKWLKKEMAPFFKRVNRYHSNYNSIVTLLPRTYAPIISSIHKITLLKMRRVIMISYYKLVAIKKRLKWSTPSTNLTFICLCLLVLYRVLFRVNSLFFDCNCLERQNRSHSFEVKVAFRNCILKCGEILV